MQIYHDKPTFNYILELLESFNFTPSEDSGHRNFFSAYPQETKRLSEKNRIINDGLAFEYLQRNKTNSLFFLH